MEIFYADTDSIMVQAVTDEEQRRMEEIKKKFADDLDFYSGVRDQDGWESLELTVRDNHSKEDADIILRILEEEQNERHT